MEEEHARRLLPEFFQHETATPNPPHWQDPPSCKAASYTPLVSFGLLFLSRAAQQYTCIARTCGTGCSCIARTVAFIREGLACVPYHSAAHPGLACVDVGTAHVLLDALHTHLPRPLVPVHEGARV